MKMNKAMWKFSLFGTNISFGRSSTKLAINTNIETTFAGITVTEQAKSEVKQMIDFLKTSDGFQGTKLLHIVGSTSANRMLVASAFAGESRVPFFTIEASDFVNDFAGVPASMLRELFNQARKNIASVIFIDNIGALFPARIKGDAIDSERKRTQDQLFFEVGSEIKEKRLLVITGTNSCNQIDLDSLRAGPSDSCLQIEYEQDKLRVSSYKWGESLG